jgi:aromatic ring-opening dioxygenase catalytic subunit (LigB family)
MAKGRQPALFIPHGGGPCFFMDDPPGLWTELRQFLESLPAAMPVAPKAILLVSGHWETDGFAFTAGAHPPLIYDYYGFPPHTYELRYDAPGEPSLAARAAGLLKEAGLNAALDPERGFDHGVFIPLKVAWPDAEVPIVEMSVDRSLDPALHIAAGQALAPLRDEGVLIIGSGMSFHNMGAYRDPEAMAPSAQFDEWLNKAAEAAPPARDATFTDWERAPMARYAHPREEHLIPLMVAAGASESSGRRIFNGTVLGTMISGFRFD